MRLRVARLEFGRKLVLQTVSVFATMEHGVGWDITLNEKRWLLWNPHGEIERLEVISGSAAGVPSKDQSLSINAGA